MKIIIIISRFNSLMPSKFSPTVRRKQILIIRLTVDELSLLVTDPHVVTDKPLIIWPMSSSLNWYFE